MRKGPHEHEVKKHTRNGSQVSTYTRGEGDPTPHKTINKRILGTRTSKLTADFIRRLHRKRSPTAQKVDEGKRAPLTTDYKKWVHAPNQYDVIGVDSPGGHSKASKIDTKKYSNAQLSINQIGGIHRVHVWDKEGEIEVDKFGFKSKEEAADFVDKVQGRGSLPGVVASYNLATGWVQILYEKKPSRDILDKLKSEGFRYRPRSKAWAAKQSRTREALLKSLAGKVEEVNIPVGHKAKSESLQRAADKVRGQADEKYDKARKTMDLIPIGQPILVGHHSERKHRRDLKRIEKGMLKSIELTEKADKLQRAADRNRVIAEGGENPVTILNRIEKFEADRRKLEGRTNPEAVTIRRRIDERLKIERQKYKISGGVLADKVKLKVGMRVETPSGPAKIVKVSKRSIRVKFENPALENFNWKNGFKMDIKKVRKVLS